MKTILAPAMLLLSGIPLAADCGAPDADGDGYSADVDCDDTNGSTFPGAPEVCGDGLDNNCDGALDDGCALAVITPLERESLVRIGGAEGEGGHVFYDWEEAAGWDELGPFESEVEEGGQYFSSVASQQSTLGEGWVQVTAWAEARARDDVGYGFGYADGESTFYAHFELKAPTTVQVHTWVYEHLGHNGGDAEASVALLRDGATVFAYNSNQGDQSIGEALQLPPGRYDVAASTRAWVDLGGGGDAYPSAEAEVDFEVRVLQAP